jgi:hypothetical protein
MRYRDLVQFEPLETIIQLRDADQKGEAEQLVRTYVISDRMAEQIARVIIPELQFQTQHENKGVLIVGNYGTGKSHLMSVISAIAEHADLLPLIEDAEVREAAQAVAGKFKVVRVEIGGVDTPLRDMLLGSLERALAAWDTPYSFPRSGLVNHKDVLIEAVATFQQRYPGQGILLVVDELLDFLRARNEQQLTLDLGFLRELGEVATHTAFRVLAGLQEALFDSPHFQFAAQPLYRVRERFETVRIVREDVAFVVAHRLLRKTPEQMARISEHLRRFTPLYGRMAERLEEFARLFPIHPAYIETFEKVYIAEKRQVLKTFTLAIRSLLDEEVPTDEPGLVSYDHYWGVLSADPSMRNLEGVRLVIERSGVLEGRVANAYTRKHLLAMALRIVHGLSVHRLTTHDISLPLGPTAEELRDDLCLHVQAKGLDAQLLLDQVQVALREIMRTVTGQYISHNEDNGQYYLDLQKDVDFEAKIRERGEFMSKGDLNLYFFDALRQALELSPTTYVSGHRIWPYELPWAERRVTRPGYLFFGAPDERSTAQPPRDFYVYVLPPFMERAWSNGEQADEVIFELTGLHAAFEEMVRLYAGARALANEAAEHRDVYAQKAEEYRQRLTRWLRENMTERLQVTYEGVAQPVRTVLSRSRSTASETMADLLRVLASELLAPAFEEHYPEYPNFRRAGQVISEAGRPTSAMEAIRFLAGHGRTNLTLAVLEGLELIDAEGTVRPYQSRYARRFLELLQGKPEGQVVNRGELVVQVAGGIVPIEKDIFFGLEPEWVAVVLVALAYNGDIVLSLDGRQEIDAGSVERAATHAMRDLTDFRFYKRPVSVPVNLWVMIFEGLGLAPGLIRDENTREEAVRELQRVVQAEQHSVATLQARLQQGLQLWNTPVLTDRFSIVSQGGTVVASDRPAVTLGSADLLPHLRGYRQFLEELSRINTVGRLRKLRLSGAQIGEALEDRKVAQRIDQLVRLVDQQQPLAAYLAEAQASLPESHDWTKQAAQAHATLLEGVRRFGRGEVASPSAGLLDLAGLKAAYVAAYATLHRRLVLGPGQADRRQALFGDARLASLDTLAAIPLLNRGELDAWRQALSSLPACREFHEGALADAPTCPSCHLRPASQAGRAPAAQELEHLDRRLGELLHGWRQALRAALQSESAQRSLAAMGAAERRPIELFLAQSDEDTEIPEGFVEAATQALRGIEALTLLVQDLVEALKAGGLPCTVDELERRFHEHLAQAMRGYDRRNTRLTLGSEEGAANG